MRAVPEHEVRVEISIESDSFGVGEGDGVVVCEGKIEEHNGSWGRGGEFGGF